MPTDFGCGVIIPLVKNIDGDMTSSENYRGITLSPVIRKLFELVLMEMVGEKLTSSPLQFGFKAYSSHFYTSDVSKAFLQFRQHTHPMCTRFSKAFDRVDVYGLLNALITRRFPKTFVCIMFNWLQNMWVQFDGGTVFP